MSAEIWGTQLSFAIGLLGVYLGWKGVISRMTGFFDMAGAVKYLLYGIVSGMILAISIDSILLSGINQSSLNIFYAISISLLIALTESTFVLFLLSRKRLIELRGSPPFGWSLGLGIGSMQASLLIYRLFVDTNLSSQYSGVGLTTIVIAFFISISSGLGQALISSWQGSMILDQLRFRPLIFSSIFRSILILSLTLSIFVPFLILVNIPAIMYFWPYAQEKWLISGMTPAAKQAYRRTLRQSSTHKEKAASREKGEILVTDE